MTTRFVRLTITLGLVMSALGGALADTPLPSLKSAELAQGPYSSMHMLLEKTFLNVDVLTVDVRFGRQVRPKLAVIAEGQRYSEALGKQTADAAIAANDALVQLRFLRSVSLDQWMDTLFENLDRAQRAKLITASLNQRVRAQLPKTFAALKGRGFEEGDSTLYRVRADSLRTVMVSAHGRVFVDQMDVGEGPSRAVMASFFAPKSDFREPLLRSLFK